MNDTTTCTHNGTGRIVSKDARSCYGCGAALDPKEITYGIRDRNLDPCGGGTDLAAVTAAYLDMVENGDSDGYGEAPFALFRSVQGERPVMLYWNGEAR